MHYIWSTCLTIVPVTIPSFSAINYLLLIDLKRLQPFLFLQVPPCQLGIELVCSEILFRASLSSSSLPYFPCPLCFWLQLVFFVLKRSVPFLLVPIAINIIGFISGFLRGASLLRLPSIFSVAVLNSFHQQFGWQILTCLISWPVYHCTVLCRNRWLDLVSEVHLLSIISQVSLFASFQLQSTLSVWNLQVSSVYQWYAPSPVDCPKHSHCLLFIFPITFR